MSDLVGAPAGEVHPPVVQLQLHVADGVRAVEPHEAALMDEEGLRFETRSEKTCLTAAPRLSAKPVRYLLPAGLGDGGHVEQLAGVVLNPAEHHHGDGVALPLDLLQDVAGPQGLLSLNRSPTSAFSHRVTFVHGGGDGTGLGASRSMLPAGSNPRSRI